MDTEVITEQELDRSGMAFWQSGHQGINLLKIHGALDVFTFKDGKDLVIAQLGRNATRRAAAAR